MRYIFVKQDGLKDCGVASLLMIIKFYKGNCTKEYLRELTHTTKEGTTGYDLLMAGKKFNFTTFGLKGKIEELKEEYFPVIAHVVIDESYQHFIVIYKMNLKKKELIVADPRIGIIKISIDEFLKISTNKFLIFVPNTSILKINTQHPIPKLIYEFLKDKKKSFIIIFILSLLYTILSILITFYFQILSSYLTYNLEIPSLIVITLSFSIFILLKSLFQYIRINILIKVTNSFDNYLFTNIYHRLFLLPDSYYQNRTTGEVVSRITDLSNLKEIISKILISVILDLLLAIISLFFMFKISVLLTFILIIFIIINANLFFFYKDKTKLKISILKEEYAKVHSYLTDTIGAVFNIRNLQVANHIEKRFNKIYCNFLNSFKEHQKLCNRQMFFKNFIYDFLNLILISLGCYIIYIEKIEMSVFLTFMFLTSYFISPFENVYDFLLDYQESFESFTRIKEFFQVDTLIPNKDFKFEKINTIKIENLTYSYLKKDIIFHNLNLTFYKNDKILIYGKSGCGKSTLIKILTGYIKDYQGNILLNDKLITEEERSILHKNITYISQEELLLNMTIKENIILGRDIPLEKFQEICRILYIDDFVLKNVLAYDMLLEENGGNLSGGERQRIILARSLLKVSDVYILDESLCNMDVELERRILKNLFNYLKDKIVIVVSHRFYNDDLYNRKIELQKGGRCAEINTRRN